MADPNNLNQSVTLDASQFISATAAIAASVTSMNNTLNTAANTFTAFNQSAQGIEQKLTKMEAALNSTATTSKVTAKAMLLLVQSNRDLDVTMTQVAKSTGEAAASLQNMGNAATKTGQATSVFARGFNLSFGNIVRLLEVTLIRRFFLNLLEGMSSSVAKATEFQQKMGQVAAVARNAGGSFESLSKQVLELSNEFNKPSADVAAAQLRAYAEQTIRAESDTNVLSEAVRLSKITFTTAEQAVESLNAILKAYGLSNVDAANTTNQLNRLFQTTGISAVQQGAAFQSLMSTASQLNAPLSQVMGALQAMRDRGIPAGEAITQLNRVLTQLLNPTPVISRALAGIGAASGHSAIEANTLSGALNRLRLIASDEHIRDLFGTRNSRAAQALTDVAANTRNTAGFDDTAENATRAGLAGREIAKSAGEQFSSELNKVANFLIGDVGPKFLEAINKMAKPFGGLSELIKQLMGIFQDLAKAIIIIGQTFANIIGFTSKFGLTIATLVEGLIAYKFVIMASTAFTRAFAASQAAIAAPTAISAATNALAAYSGMAIPATVATGRLAVAMNGLKVAALSLGPIAIAIGLAMLITQLVKAADTTRQLSDALEGIDSKAKKGTEGLVEHLAAVSRQSESATTSLRANLANGFASSVTELESLMTTQREVVDRAREAFASASTIIVANLSNVFSNLEQRIKQAQSNIQESLKQIQSFSEKTEKDLFQKRLATAGEVNQLTRFKTGQEAIDAQRALAAHAAASKNQEILLQQRINQLLQESAALSAKGDKDSLDAMRRKMEEVRALTNQSFDIQRAQNRREGDFRAQATGRNQSYDPLDNERAAALRGLDTQQTSNERTAQNVNSRVEATLQAVIDLERGRLREVNITQNRLRDFSLTDTAGNLHSRFQGDDGRQTFENEFRARRAAAENDMTRPVIDPGMIAELSRQVGDTLASQTRRNVEAGQLTAGQASQLTARGATPEMVALMRQESENFRANAENLARWRESLDTFKNSLDAMFGREQQKNQLQQLQNALATRIDSSNTLLREMIRVTQEANHNLTTQFRSVTTGVDVAISNVRDLTPSVFFEPTGTANRGVMQANQGLQRSINEANANRTPENQAAVEANLQTFIDRLQAFVAARQRDNPAGRDDPRMIRFETTIAELKATLQSIREAGRARENGLTGVAAAQGQQQQLAAGTAFAIGGSNTPQNTQDSFRMLAQVLAPIDTHMADLAKQISNLAGVISGNRNVPPELRPRSSNGGGVPGALMTAMEGMATGALPTQRAQQAQQAQQALIQQVAQQFGVAGSGTPVNSNRPSVNPTGGSLDFGASSVATAPIGSGPPVNITNLNAANIESAQRVIQRMRISDLSGVTSIARMFRVNPNDLQPASIPIQLGVGAGPVITLPGDEEEGFASGGLIGNAFSSFGPDNVNIRARVGEFVVNPESSRQFYTQLVAMNRGDSPRGNSYAQGGTVSNSIGNMNINVSGAEHPNKTARAVYNTIRREQRRGNI